MSDIESYLAQAIELAMENVRERKALPFGAVMVRDGEVVAVGVNQVQATCDPSAHAEMQAVRAAGHALGSADLSGCIVYASGYPCAMCLAAMYLSGVREVYYAYSNEAGEPYGLSAAGTYEEIAKPIAERSIRLVGVPVRSAGNDLYDAWRDSHENGP